MFRARSTEQLPKCNKPKVCPGFGFDMQKGFTGSASSGQELSLDSLCPIVNQRERKLLDSLRATRDACFLGAFVGIPFCLALPRKFAVRPIQTTDKVSRSPIVTGRVQNEDTQRGGRVGTAKGGQWARATLGRTRCRNLGRLLSQPPLWLSSAL